MNTKRILIYNFAVLLALTLGGCADVQKQAFNRDAQ
jgi:hypothetical protein